MSYMLRDRPDGQVEIILTKPILVGIFPEREVAQRVCTFLREEAIDWPTEEAASFSRASADVAEALEANLDDLVEAEDADEAGEARLRDLVEKSRPAPALASPPPVRNLPAVVQEKPVAPVFLTDTPITLSPQQQTAAFKRIAEGDKLSVVALELGVGMPQLRGMWTGYKRRMQKHLAEGGQVACTLCTKPFTPSISHPDTCARCSHD